MTDAIKKLEDYLKSLPENKFCFYANILEHCLKRGIDTIEKYHHDMASTNHYELFRDVNGYKPRFIDYSAMSTDEILEDIQNLHNQYEENQKEEKLQIEAYSRHIQERKARNKYKPNTPFADLKSILQSSK